MPECQSEVPPHARRAGAVGQEATFEVKLHRASDELWGFAWSYSGLSDWRLIISGVNARSPAGRFANLQSGDELLSVNGAKGLEDMRRELYEALDVALLFRSAAQSPPPPPSTRRSMAPASGARKPASLASRRQAPIAPPSIKARMKNSFIHFSDSEEVGESSDDGLFSTSDPLPISRLGKPINFRSPYMSGCLAGLDLPRVAAVCDSARSDEDWASARSLSSEDGNTSGDHSNQSIPSCPSTDWDYPSYPPVAAAMSTAQYFQPLATALPNAQCLGRLMMWPCPVGGVGCGVGAVNANAAAEVPAHELPAASLDAGVLPAESPAVATTSGVQDEVSDNMDGSRPLTHSDPSDKSEGGSSEAGPLPKMWAEESKTMAKLWEGDGWLKPDDPQSSMDESTTYASTILGPQKKVRRGGKRMHRPCHQKAKQESEGQKVLSLSNMAGDVTVNRQNSEVFEGRSFYPASRKKLPHANIAGQADSTLMTAAMGEEPLPPEGERVSVAAAPIADAALPESEVVPSPARDGMEVDSPFLVKGAGSELMTPEVQVSQVAKRKASPTKPVRAKNLLNAPNLEADVDVSTCSVPDVQVPTMQYFKAPPSRSPGGLAAKSQKGALPSEPDVTVTECAVPSVQPSPEPKHTVSSTACAGTVSTAVQSDMPFPKNDGEVSQRTVSKVQSARVQKRKVSRRRSSGGSASKGRLDVQPPEAVADVSDEKVPDAQPSVVQKRNASPTKASGKQMAKGSLETQSPKPASDRQPSPMPKRNLQPSRTSGAQAVQAPSGASPSEADADVSRNAIPEVRPSPEPKRKSALVRSSSKPARKAAPEETAPVADVDASKGAAADTQAPAAPKRKAAFKRSSSKPAAKAQGDTLPPEADLNVPNSATPRAKAAPVPKRKVMSTGSSDKPSSNVSQTKRSIGRDVKVTKAPVVEATDAADVSRSQNGHPDDTMPDGNAVTNRWQRHRVSMGSVVSGEKSSSVSEEIAVNDIKNSSQAGTAARGSGVSAPKWRPSLRLRQ